MVPHGQVLKCLLGWCLKTIYQELTMILVQIIILFCLLSKIFAAKQVVCLEYNGIIAKPDINGKVGGGELLIPTPFHFLFFLLTSVQLSILPLQSK